MTDLVKYRWRGAITDGETVELVQAHGGHPVPGWWDQVRSHSLGWVAARLNGGTLAGFVNVAWDGSDHAGAPVIPPLKERQWRRGILPHRLEIAREHRENNNN